MTVGTLRFQHAREECETKKVHVFQVPDVWFVRTLLVVIFTLFYCLLDLSCCECDIISLYFMRCSVNGSVCLVYYAFDSVCELFGETIRNVFGCGCYFVVYLHVVQSNIVSSKSYTYSQLLNFQLTPPCSPNYPTKRYA